MGTSRTESFLRSHTIQNAEEIAAAAALAIADWSAGNLAATLLGKIGRLAHRVASQKLTCEEAGRQMLALFDPPAKAKKAKAKK